MEPHESDGLIVSTSASTPAPAGLSSMKKGTIIVALLLVLPYAMSKMAIAAYTAYQELLFGNTIGGAALMGEADAYHVLFLFMGTAMGGLRATSIVAAPSFRDVPRRLRMLVVGHGDVVVGSGAPQKEGHAGGTLQRVRHLCVALIRGLPSAHHNNTGGSNNGDIENDNATDNIIPPEPLNDDADNNSHNQHQGEGGDHNVLPTILCDDPNALVVVSTSFVMVYSLTSALLMKFASSEIIHGIAPWTSHPVLRVVASFGDGFWWGSFPTLLLYNKEQLLLASGHSLLPLFYGGVVYCGIGSYMAKDWVGPPEAYSNSSASGYDDAVNNGVRQIGLSLAASAAVGYAALKIHLWLDPRTRAHDNPSLCSGLALWRCYKQHGNSFALFQKKLFAALKTFLLLAIPLAISNSLGLIRQLIVTATTSECNSNAAQAYSISQAYYSTAEIALLAASSTISAIVAVDRSFENAAIVVVVGFSLILGVLPLFIPTEIAQFFGGSVYSYGKAEVDEVIHDVRYFNILSTIAFCLVAAAMAISATLHGRRMVWWPLLIQFVSNALGVAWTVVMWTEHTKFGVDCVWQSGGSVVTAFVSVIALILLRRKYVH